MNAKMREIAATDEMRKKMTEISADVPLQTPEEIAAFMKNDFATNAELIKIAKVKLE